MPGIFAIFLFNSACEVKSADPDIAHYRAIALGPDLPQPLYSAFARGVLTKNMRKAARHGPVWYQGSRSACVSRMACNA